MELVDGGHVSSSGTVSRIQEMKWETCDKKNTEKTLTTVSREIYLGVHSQAVLLAAPEAPADHPGQGGGAVEFGV